MRIYKYLVFILAISFVTMAIADEIPIEDQSPNTNTVQQQNQPADQRITKLEQQVQQLQGELDEQTQEVQILNEKLQNFYQDLNQKIQQLPQTVTGGGVSSQEEQEYQTAFDSLSAKKYDVAVQLMQKYLTDYPTGKYAANAHYWLGEIYYLQNNLTQSAAEMQVVLKQFARSPKVPDAMLKIAMIYNAQKKYNQARDELQQIKKQFPDSTAAQLVDQQMQTIGASS